jgi:YggT family protein
MILHWSSAWIFLINFMFTLYALVFLTRFALSWSRVDPRHPLIQGIGRITWPLLRPFYRYGGGRRLRRDWWSLAWAFFLCWLDLAILAFWARGPVVPWPMLILAAGVKGLTLLDDLYIFTLIVGVVLSWFVAYPGHPMLSFLEAIYEPLLRPLRRLLPVSTGFDFAPVLALAFLFFVNILLPGIRIR